MKKPAWMAIVFLTFLVIPVLAGLALFLGVAIPIIGVGAAIAFIIGLVVTLMTRR